MSGETPEKPAKKRKKRAKPTPDSGSKSTGVTMAATTGSSGVNKGTNNDLNYMLKNEQHGQSPQSLQMLNMTPIPSGTMSQIPVLNYSPANQQYSPQYTPTYFVNPPPAITNDTNPPQWAQDILNKIESITSRLDKIDSIESAVRSMSVKLDSVNKDVSEIRGRVMELEKSQQFLSDTFEEVKDMSNQTSVQSKEIRHDFDELTNKLKADNVKLSEEILDLRSRSMRDNLLFFNVPETDGENCQNLILEICEKDLNIEKAKTALVIDRAHRIGAKKQHNTRPIVVKFNMFTQREEIRKRSHLLRNSNPGISIGEQLPKEIQNRRKELLPKLREAKDKGNRAHFVLDKLYINGRVYEGGPIHQNHTQGTQRKSSGKTGTHKGPTDKNNDNTMDQNNG